MRQFKLINATGAEFDMMRRDAWLYDPDGFGTGLDISLSQVGDSYIVTDVRPKMPTPSGTMIFKDYPQYYEFLAFIRSYPLLLAYKPLDRWLYLPVYVSTNLSEIGEDAKVLKCPLDFSPIGEWYESVTEYKANVDTGVGKVYGYHEDTAACSAASALTLDAAKANGITALRVNGSTAQPGTGDPSPTNIRPIYGVGQYDGKTVLNGQQARLQYNTTINAALIGGYSDVAPPSGNNATAIMLTNYLPVKSASAINGGEIGVGINTAGVIYLRIAGLKSTDEYNQYLAAHPLNLWYKSTAYATATQVYCGLSITDANGYHGYAAGPMARLYDGDTVDFATGECKRTKGYIASYAGGVLPGKWISDRDVYVAGATPTNGAQVVYELSTPTTETVPISAPITNAAGIVTVSSPDGAMDVTYTRARYGYQYSYTYSSSETGTIAVDGIVVPSYCRLHILGPCTNPAWSLYQNDVLVASGKCNVTVASGNKLVINSDPPNMELALYSLTNTFLANEYQNSDFSTERFLRLPVGDSRLYFSHDGPGLIDAYVEVKKRV